MELFFKEWREYPVKIPNGAYMVDREGLEPIKAVPGFPVPYCWEIQCIHRIAENKEGLFDFSKSMIDIGAGFGEYSFLLNFRHSYAFEPCRTANYIMHANLVLHDRIYQTETFETCLSDKVEEVMFDGFNANVGNAASYKEDKSKPVLTKTLDSFDFENIGFVKVDVEGMEEKVLRGGVETLKRNNFPPILFECWDVGYNTMTQEKHDSLYSFLEDLGYTVLNYWGDYETHLAVRTNKK